jgi:photosystem II stability/assembly factor-like uncharacterized protein
MKSSSFICIAALVLANLMFCLAGCGVKADHQENDLVKQSPVLLNMESPPINKLASDPTRLRFVAEPTQGPELYSRGSYIDEQHAWVAAGFEVKRTTDGGRTWQLMRPSTEDESAFGKMGSIYVMPSFITPTRGWLNASKGIWQTEDGGSTWRQIFAEDTGDPYFADEQHGWIGTYTEKYQQSYVTKDGGQSWQLCGVKRRLNQQTPNQAFFLTPQHGWAITSHTDDERRTIYGVAQTTDGGCSWRQLWTSDEDPDEMYCQIYFLNEKEGWLAGCYSTGSLIETKDGGITWHKAQTPIDAWRATPIEVYFANSIQGWIITKATEFGNPEGIYRTDDGGRTWRQLTEEEIIGGFRAGNKRNAIPKEWKAGRLAQMLYASKIGASRQ